MNKKTFLLPIVLFVFLFLSACSNASQSDVQKQQDRELQNKIQCQKDAESFRLNLEKQILSVQESNSQGNYTFNKAQGDYIYKFNDELNTCLFYGNYEGQYPIQGGSKTNMPNLLTMEYVYDIYTNNEIASYSNIHPILGQGEWKSQAQKDSEMAAEVKFAEKKKELFGN